MAGTERATISAMDLSRGIAVALVTLVGCGDPTGSGPPFVSCPELGGTCPGSLAINELMSDNEGAWVDEVGESDDWIELINTGRETLSLAGYHISDSTTDFHPLPAIELEPGEGIVLWADGEPEQGELHLPFKLSSRGETVFLVDPDRYLIERLNFPEMEPNDSFSRFPDGDGALQLCRWASPARRNGDTCGPPPPAELPVEVDFEDFEWPTPWPEPPDLLTMTELALRPAEFIEVLNVSDSEIDLADFILVLADHAPGRGWPESSEGVQLVWPVESLAPGERVAVPVNEEDVAAISATEDFEGVVTLWDVAAERPVQRVDFVSWPEYAALTRVPDESGRHRFCAALTPGEGNEACDPLPSREINGRLRHLRTPGDFAALADGAVSLGIEPVKFIVDMDAGHVVHLLGSRSWDLHYTFVRELIEGQEHLDRCDPDQNAVFRRGWSEFSQDEYFDVEGRRFLLGTLVHHGSNDLWTMEFTTGDRISADQMFRAFFTVAHRLDEPTRWALRPQGSRQVEEMLRLDGMVPIVDTNAPFRDVTFQPLTEGVAYGVLTFVPAADLESASLGPQVIVVTDQVPNDIPLVGGLITEAFQTPLAHVNVLSRNRGTPNMALRDARGDERVAEFLDTLVRLEVIAGSFGIRPADPEEAREFWEEQQGSGPSLRPRLNRSVRGIQPLSELGYEDLDTIGAKAALLAELATLVTADPDDRCPLTVPVNAFAIPLVHSLEHYDTSGAADLLEALRNDPEFLTDPRVRAEGLAAVRQAVLEHPVDPELLDEVTGHVAGLFGGERVRFRSSSNTEDLAGFNGAGLYTSISGAVDDPERAIEDAIRVVWASLYNGRAFDERSYYNVEESRVAMGILVHRAFLSERVNGVAISRNILNPIRSDQYYVNTQVGEASVTNPAPGVTSEQLIYRRGRTPRVIYHAQSSLPGGNPVLSDREVETLACTIDMIHDHFVELLDPDSENRWFAMDIEFKLLGDGRTLMVKQARPYVFAHADISSDCREF